MTAIVTSGRMMPFQDADLAQQNKLRIRSSNAAALAQHKADDQEILTSIEREGLKASIEQAQSFVQAELRPPVTPTEQETMIAAVTAFLRLVGGGWHPDQRTEWIDAATDELIEYPMSLSMPAIAHVRKRCRSGAAFVQMVVEFLEPQLERLKAEAVLVDQLYRISQA